MSELVRFVVQTVVDEDSQNAIGIVHLAYRLVDDGETDEAIRQPLKWLEANLAVPDRFNRTTSKGWYRRQTRGLSWLRASATEHVAVMQRLAEAVTKAGYVVREIRTERAGYVTYEDDHQVVAEPFRDTRTR